MSVFDNFFSFNKVSITKIYKVNEELEAFEAMTEDEAYRIYNVDYKEEVKYPPKKSWTD